MRVSVFDNELWETHTDHLVGADEWIGSHDTLVVDANEMLLESFALFKDQTTAITPTSSRPSL